MCISYMPLIATVNTIAECLRTDCNILGDKKKSIVLKTRTRHTDYIGTCHIQRENIKTTKRVLHSQSTTRMTNRLQSTTLQYSTNNSEI